MLEEQGIKEELDMQGDAVAADAEKEATGSMVEKETAPKEASLLGNDTHSPDGAASMPSADAAGTPARQRKKDGKNRPNPQAAAAAEAVAHANVSHSAPTSTAADDTAVDGAPAAAVRSPVRTCALPSRPSCVGSGEWGNGESGVCTLHPNQG